MNTRFNIFIIIIIQFGIILLCTTCNKELEERNYPSLTTLEAKDISESGVTFQAIVENTSHSKILSQGFLWGNPVHFPSQYDSVSINNISQNGRYSIEVDYALPQNKEISFCSFVRTNDFKILGNIKKFTPKGSKPPIIGNYLPKIGTDGDSIVITGTGFSKIHSNYKVFFGDIEGEIFDVAYDKVIAGVPENYSVSETVPLILKMFDEEYNVGHFRLDSLTITNINLQEVFIASSVLEITLNHPVKNIGYLKAGNSEISKDFITIKGNKISINVPPDSPAGYSKILGLINNKQIQSKTEIKFISPWTKKGDCPINYTNKTAPNGFSHNGNVIYCISNNGTNLWQYTPEANQWELIHEPQLTELLREGMITFSLDDKYYWGGGLNSWPQNLTNFNINEFNPEFNTSNLNSNFGNTIILSYEYQQQYPTIAYCFSIGIDTKAYVFGGLISTNYPEIPLLIYDCTNDKWDKSESFDKTLNYKYWYGLTGFEIDGKIFLGTGTTNNGVTNEFWMYEPEKDTWTKLSDFPGSPRNFAVGFAISGIGYLGLGSSETWYIEEHNSFNDMYEYDPETDTWAEVANFPGGGKSGAGVALLKDKAYIGFGNRKKDLWEFSPFSK